MTEPKLITLNLNHWVRVKLTPEGRVAYQEKMQRIAAATETPPKLEPTLDADGRWRIQFSSLIRFIAQAERIEHEYPIYPDDVIYEDRP